YGHALLWPTAADRWSARCGVAPRHVGGPGADHPAGGYALPPRLYLRRCGGGRPQPSVLGRRLDQPTGIDDPVEGARLDVLHADRDRRRGLVLARSAGCGLGHRPTRRTTHPDADGSPHHADDRDDGLHPREQPRPLLDLRGDDHRGPAEYPDCPTDAGTVVRPNTIPAARLPAHPG